MDGQPNDPEPGPDGRHALSRVSGLKLMTTLAGLECPPYPSRRYPGDDDRSQASRDDEDQVDPPTDGRQLLGWAAKQVPDAKLDRLVRSTSVMDYIKRSGVPFTAC